MPTFQNICVSSIEYKDRIAEEFIHKQRYYNGEIHEQREMMVKQVESVVKRECKVSDEYLRRVTRGRENEARKVVIRLIREKAGLSCKQ